MSLFRVLGKRFFPFLVAGFLATCGGSSGGGGSSPGDDLTTYVDMASANLARIIADPGRPYVYLSDSAANAVHFFNTDTYSIDKTIVVGSNPGMMDIKADGSLLFIALLGGSDIAVIDLTARTLLSPIGVPGTPNALAVGANDRLYVSYASAISIYDISALPAVSVGTISKGAFGTIIGGVTADRTKLFTHDASTALPLTQWDISTGVPTEIQSVDVSSGPPVISSSPDSTSFLFVGNFSYFDTRFPLYDGDVPIFKTTDLLKKATVNVEWDPLAVAICPITGSVLVAHSDTVVNTTRPVRHSQGTGDLHAFDGSSYIENKRYTLRNRVKQYGIGCGPDGRIYLILGVGVGKAIGVIEP